MSTVVAFTLGAALVVGVVLFLKTKFAKTETVKVMNGVNSKLGHIEDLGDKWKADAIAKVDLEIKKVI